jgi:hypothetical protein
MPQLIRTIALASRSIQQFDQTILIRDQVDVIADRIDTSRDEDGGANPGIDA